MSTTLYAQLKKYNISPHKTTWHQATISVKSKTKNDVSYTELGTIIIFARGGG